jgi:RNA polymerase sigma factor (TIGR02999 family)
MTRQSPSSITGLLKAWGEGDQTAFERLVPFVDAQLRRLARRYRGGERVGHTLQPTALINEVYLRLIDWGRIPWQDRVHFFGLSARLMRRVLVDHARLSAGASEEAAGDASGRYRTNPARPLTKATCSPWWRLEAGRHS